MNNRTPMCMLFLCMSGEYHGPLCFFLCVLCCVRLSRQETTWTPCVIFVCVSCVVVFVCVSAVIHTYTRTYIHYIHYIHTHTHTHIHTYRHTDIHTYMHALQTISKQLKDFENILQTICKQLKLLSKQLKLSNKSQIYTL